MHGSGNWNEGSRGRETGGLLEMSPSPSSVRQRPLAEESSSEGWVRIEAEPVTRRASAATAAQSC